MLSPEETRVSPESPLESLSRIEGTLLTLSYLLLGLTDLNQVPNRCYYVPECRKNIEKVALSSQVHPALSLLETDSSVFWIMDKYLMDK